MTCGRRALFGVLLGGAVVACRRSDATPSPPYSVAVLVEADAATPLAEAALLRDGTLLGKTGADGRATLALRGAEGDTVAVAVQCPPAYTSPQKPLDVVLRRLEKSAQLPSYRVACPPELRTTVVAVRATNGPDLPVLYLGKEIGRTDRSGAAHVELRLHPGERFELTLGTQEPGAEKLIPKNPTAVFVVKDHDEMLFFDQRFDTQKSRAVKQRRGPKAF